MGRLGNGRWFALVLNRFGHCFSFQCYPPEVGPVFAHLFQQSIDKGEIPKEWSLVNIFPLFKKGDRPLACNCRPVSLTCVPCKLLVHIVCSNIMAHLAGIFLYHFCLL